MGKKKEACSPAATGRFVVQLITAPLVSLHLENEPNGRKSAFPSTLGGSDASL